MSLYEVAFEFTMQQTVLVDAASGKAAMEAVKAGDYDATQCESTRVGGDRRKRSVQKVGGSNE